MREDETMSESAKGTRLVKLRKTDDLYSGTGHPLTRTYYSYDREGMIGSTLQIFHYCDDETSPMGFPMRETSRDAYHIITEESVEGQDGTSITIPRIILYEKDEAGKIRQIVEAVADEEKRGYFQIIETIGYENTRPHQRGHVIRERHLDSDGSFEWEYQHEYDDHGWKVRTNHVSPDGRLELGRRKRIEYDDRGNTVYYNNGHEYAIENTYDEDGYLKTAMVRKKSRLTGQWDLIGRHEYGYEEFEIDLPEDAKAPEPT